MELGEGHSAFIFFSGRPSTPLQGCAQIPVGRAGEMCHFLSPSPAQALGLPDVAGGSTSGWSDLGHLRG